MGGRKKEGKKIEGNRKGVSEVVYKRGSRR